MPEPHDDLLNELTPAEWRLVVSLVEAIATSDEGECPVCHRQIDRAMLAEHIAHCRDFSTVRTRRLDIVAGDGTVLATVGELTRPPAMPLVGLALLDGTGLERAVLALDHEGPKLEMASNGGNKAAVLGVNDDAGEVEASTYLTLFDREGKPIQSWQVDAAGRLAKLTAEAESEADHG